MRDITTTVYKFAELSDSAKQKAIENNRYWNTEDDWFDCTIEDFKTIGGILGIDFDTYPVKLMNGGVRQNSKIWFSGFSSQGDGASFEGRWQYAKGMAKKIREYAPEDKELHKIADCLANIQRKWFYGINTKISKSGRYCHEYSMQFEHYHNSDCEISESVTDEIDELMRDLARWLHSSLQKNYDYLTSDEAIRESIEAHEMEFNEDGLNA